MTQTKTGNAALSMLLLVLLLVGQLQMPMRLPTGPGSNTNLQATVRIKTQKAANSLQSQGGIRGIDVSKWQGRIDWAKVAQDDVKYAMIRASIGKENDPLFLTNARQAHENGLKVGAYHYATFTNRSSMKAEAAVFLNQIKQVDITYPVVLDLEAHRGLKRSALTQLALEFMDILKEKGYTVMLYSYQNFITSHLDIGKLSNYDFWVANYIELPRNIPHQMWQHTSYGTVSGIKGRVDINIAYADLSVKKKKVVSKSVSDNIKDTINTRYNTDIGIDGIDLQQINTAIATGLQQEINRQWQVDIPVTGELSDLCLSYLQQLNFTRNTNGNITYLLQAKLFYKGFYGQDPTSYFDEETSAALAAYQEEQGLAATGEMDQDTLYYLLYL